MPNVTIFLPADKMPVDGALSELTGRCTEICTRTLQAAPDNVHIMYVLVQHGRGHALFVDIRYRLTASRTPRVMESFMEELEESIHDTTGFTPRIRCFGYNAASLHARN